MPRIAPVVSSNTDTKVAATLSQLKASGGEVPNIFAMLANAPAALDRYLDGYRTPTLAEQEEGAR